MRALPPVAGTALRFAVVGIANTATTLAVVWLLHEQFGAAVWLASGAGYAVGTVQGFLLSRYWTFAGGDHAAPLAAQMAGFVAVNLVCGTLFSWLNQVLSAGLPLLASSLLATAIVTPVSFALNRWGVFRERRA